ncbi:MAG: hypothetical protein LBT20_06770 [Clostridiales bacterium]|nr:hypothetical protein [Clostridiales bacterium]
MRAVTRSELKAHTALFHDRRAFLQRFFHAAVLFTLLSAILALALNSQIYTASVLRGLKLFFESVFPSVFPFAILSGLILNVVTIETEKENFLKKTFSKLFSLPPSFGYAFLLSLLSGYPVGARLTHALCRKKNTDPKQVIAATALTSVAGPLFLLNVVGFKFFGDIKIGIILVFSQVTAALLSGFIFRPKGQSYVQPPQIFDDKRNTPRVQSETKLFDLVGESITASVSSMLSVGGTIAFFYMLSDMLKNSPFLTPILELLTRVTKNPQASDGILFGLIEMTRGAADVAVSGLPLVFAVPAAAALVAFGGLSVAVQNLICLKGSALTVRAYFKIKAVQAVIAGITAGIIMLLSNR